MLGVHEQHYFLGYKPKLFDGSLFGIKLSIGLYLPLAGLFKTHRIENDQKIRVRYTWEFFEHSLWKRFIVTIGSIIALTLSSILIFIALRYQEKDLYISKEEVNKHGIYPSFLAERTGFKKGDKILLINGKDYERYDDLLNPEIFLKKGSHFTIQRDGKELDLPIQENSSDEIFNEELPYFSVLAPFEVYEVFPNTAAEKAGLRAGDVISKVNDEPIVKIHEFNAAIEQDTDGQVTLEVTRPKGNNSEMVKLLVTLDEHTRMGIRIREKIKYVTKTNSIREAFILGTIQPFKTLKVQIDAFYKLVSGEIVYQKSVSGPVRIAKAFGYDYQWRRFWTITALFCIVTAFMNLLPLPRAIFWGILPIAFEGLTGKKYSYSFYKQTRAAGFVIAVLLMILIVVHDIIKML